MPSRRKFQDAPTLDARLQAAFRQTYNAVAADCWGERIPDIDEFRDVILDMVECHGDLCRADLDVLRLMPDRQRFPLIGKP